MFPEKAANYDAVAILVDHVFVEHLDFVLHAVRAHSVLLFFISLRRLIGVL